MNSSVPPIGVTIQVVIAEKAPLVNAPKVFIDPISLNPQTKKSLLEAARRIMAATNMDSVEGPLRKAAVMMQALEGQPDAMEWAVEWKREPSCNHEWMDASCDDVDYNGADFDLPTWLFKYLDKGWTDKRIDGSLFLRRYRTPLGAWQAFGRALQKAKQAGAIPQELDEEWLRDESPA